jgi:putative hydrolase of the HAD superfamily
MVKISAALFDIDNTLIDFVKMKKYSCKDAVAAMVAAGLPASRKKTMRVLDELYKKYGIEYQKIFQPLVKKITGRVDWKIIASGIVAYRKAKASLLQPYPKTVPTLIRLREKGYKLGIVTDAPSMQAWTRLVESGLADFFDVVVTKDDVQGKTKPHPRPFEAALKNLCMRPDEVLFVGDNINRDVLGAKKAGMVAVLAKYGEWEKARTGIKADFEIRNISEVIKIIEKLNRVEK